MQLTYFPEMFSISKENNGFYFDVTNPKYVYVRAYVYGRSS
jgi:hypothetical protein